jgi:hypothetical protein
MKMRKNINKIVAFAIGISVMSGGITPVLAADTTQSVQTSNKQTQTDGKSILTLADCIQSAISISNTLALDENKINYQEKTNNLYDKVDDFNDPDDDVKDFNKDNADIKLKQLEQQRDFDEDKLAYDVMNKYNNIVIKQINIDKTSKELDIKKAELEQLKLKVSLGIQISTDLKSKELEIQDKQNTLTNSQNQLKDLEYSFKALTGKDVSKYTLDQDIKFEQFKIDGSLDDYLDGVIDSYLKYSNQVINGNKDYFDDDYVDDKGISLDDISDAKTTSAAAKANIPTLVDAPPVPTFTSFGDVNNYLNQEKNYIQQYQQYQQQVSQRVSAEQVYTNKIKGRIAYLATKQGMYADETNLNENKRNFKDSLKGYYTQLIDAENQINYDKKQIEVNNETLSNYKLKHDLGMITDLQYNTYVVNAEAYDLALKNEIILYNQLINEIQKPWLTLTKASLQSQQGHLDS